MLLAVALVASACGGGGEESTTTTTEDTAGTVNQIADSAAGDATTADEPAPAPTEVPPTEVPEPEGSIDDVQASTVMVQAEGTFISPVDGQQYATAGSGTGFIIDESGLVVTNNHVVTGAALLRVRVDGEDDLVNARILGVSECNDLAVIDLEGDGYQALEFRTDEIRAGLDVYAAGFPNPELADNDDVDYTLTRGIVSTVEADGESNWASVDGVIEHDARIRGGNSGGPLVDDEGRVVGINYAGNDADDYNFAIGAQEAASVIEQLKNGDVESIGINGEAIWTQDFTGIWVYSVDSGSPADESGIQAGDLLTSLETLPLATDGTMADYCDIIRTNGPEDVLDVEVYRSETGEFLEGQINGDELEVTFTIFNELASDVGGDTNVATETAEYNDYVLITDDSGAVSVEVPRSWTDLDGSYNEDFGPSIWAAPNLSGFIESYNVPGIIVEVTNQLGPGDEDLVLDGYDFSADCDSLGREGFMTDDEYFSGAWEVYLNCGGTDTGIVVLAVTPPSGDQMVRMLIQVVSDADLDAADHAIATFDAVL